MELGSFPWPVFGRHCVLAASGLIAEKLEAWRLDVVNGNVANVLLQRERVSAFKAKLVIA